MRHEGEGKIADRKDNAEGSVEEGAHHPGGHVAPTDRTPGRHCGDLGQVDARVDVREAHGAHLEEARCQQHWEVGGEEDCDVAEHRAKVAGEKYLLASEPFTEWDAEEDTEVHGNGGDGDEPGALLLGEIEEGGGGVPVGGKNQSGVAQAGAGGHHVEEDHRRAEDQEEGGGGLLGGENICCFKRRHMSSQSHLQRDSSSRFVIS